MIRISGKGLRRLWWSFALVVAAPFVAGAAPGRPPSATVAVAVAAGKTRVAITLTRPVGLRAAIDAASARLVITFDQPVSAGGRMSPAGLLRAVTASGGRWTFTLAHPAVIAAMRWQGRPAGPPLVAVIELSPGDLIAMQAVSGVAMRPVGPSLKPDDAAVAPDASRRAGPPRPEPPLASTSGKKTVAIDAGHGGIDPGADSVTGYHEKEVTLAVARALERRLEQTGRYTVVMTRDSDIYLKLHERVARARAAHANLFVSLHADSVVGGEGDARGASIYTLSETASDAESERYAQRENRADALGGDLGGQSDDVAGILVDLTVRETVNNGNRLANQLVGSLQQEGVAVFPHTPHRSAGFAVLKAPDIPSVLVEMGYLSDRSDARGLADPRHQAAIAKGVVEGIDRYFSQVQAVRR